MGKKWQDGPPSESAQAFVKSLCEQVGWPEPPAEQVATAGKVHEAIDKLKAVRQEKWDAERAVQAAERSDKLAGVEPFEPGRQEFTGTVLSAKIKDTPYGETPKMLVEDQAGRRVWCTVPSKVAEKYTCEELKGVTVKMVINLKPKDEDPHFAFGSRPVVEQVWPFAQEKVSA